MFNINQNDLVFFFARYLEYYPFLLPIGIVGLWRWTVWGVKKASGSFYRPKEKGYKATVSVITPVYNEDPKVFTRAIHSWAKNKPNEIIAVIDYTDTANIEIFKDFAKKNPFAKLIITRIPGKREALGEGIYKSKHDILALVDSDTIWTDETLAHAIAPFKDDSIGGVTTRQTVENPRSLAQKFFSVRLEQRYWDDIPFLAQSGDVLVCLSGRTSLYRRSAIMPIVKDMVVEKFMGEKVISGEDKRLTYLIEKAGWKATYQSTALVTTTGATNLSTFLNQQIRWTRNSWRNDLRALLEGWTLKYPIFTLYLIDRIIQPFTLLISPIYFFISLYLGLWVHVFVILIWWHLSRLIKMYPHLKKYPGDIKIVPLYIIFSFVSGYIRIFSLLTVNTQGWITRWDKSRISKYSFLKNIAPHLATLSLFLILGIYVYSNKYQYFILPIMRQDQLLSRALIKTNKSDRLVASANTPAVLGVSTDQNQGWLTHRYIFKENDTLSAIATKYGTTVENLIAANGSRITNLNHIDPGFSLTVPPPNVKLKPVYKFNLFRTYPDVLSIYYDKPSDHIVISGRGKTITIRDIANVVGKEYLEETKPGIWDLKTSLYLRSGLTFVLRGDEVKWLRLQSDNKKITRIYAYNSDVFIDGVTITSWDKEKNTYDNDYKNGRSYILVKDGSRMDISHSEIAYLGYPRPDTLPYSSYGISWKMSQESYGKLILTGEVTDSKFHHNYFGAYTFGATGMTWKGNEFYDNVRYGLDPHDDSNGFLVQNNIFRNNGSHGLIFSKRCLNNVIINNVSHNNALHGIMLHELSNKNYIANNTLYSNHDGLAIDHSSNNIVTDNKIFNNQRGIRANKTSINNQIERNSINENTQYGIYFYGNSNDNYVKNNILTNNVDAMYIRSNYNQAIDNTLNNNVNGIYFVGEAANNKVSGNKITYNKSIGIYSKVVSKVSNIIEEGNYVWRNMVDLRAEEVQ